MNDEGFIVISRKIFNQDSWFFKLRDPEAVLFMIYLIHRANWKPGKMFITNKMLHIKRGQFWTSVESLRKELTNHRQTLFTTQQVRTYLDVAKACSFITSETTNHGQLITIINYNTYQNVQSKSNKQSNNQPNKPVTNDQQTLNKQPNKDRTNKPLNKDNTTIKEVCEKVLDYWNCELRESLNLSKDLILIDNRIKQIRTRFKKDIFKNSYREVVEKIKGSSYLQGDNDTGWKCSFDWIFKNDSNWVKVVEGNYDRRLKPKAKPFKVQLGVMKHE